MSTPTPEKRIKDIMLNLEALRQMSPESTVLESVRLLSQHSDGKVPPFVLIVGSEENKEEIEGILTLNDVLSHMESSTEPMDELPIFWQGQFHEECEAVLERTAGEIMSPVTHVIHQSGTLTEAVHLMNSQRTDWLPVVEGEDVVGILLKEALLEEVRTVAEQAEIS